MPFNQFPAEIEAQARSADASGARIVRAHKTPEETRLLGGWNSYAMIADTEVRFVSLSFLLKCYLDKAALGTIFNRIGEQIGQDLLDPQGINCRPELGTCAM